MKYYLRRLVDLYLEYMMLAVSGLVLSTILLTFYSLIRTSSLFNKVALALIFFSISYFVIAKWHRRVVEKKALRDAELRELDRSESEARAERLQQRIQEARNYLVFMRSGGIKDYRDSKEKLPLNEELLVNEAALLIERLDQANMSDFLIKKAIERFLDLIDGVHDKSVLSYLREMVVDSIITDSVISRKAKDQDREFIS